MRISHRLPSGMGRESGDRRRQLVTAPKKPADTSVTGHSKGAS